MSADASGILDTRSTIGTPNFDRSDANWESWRVKFEAYADPANKGTHLNAAAEQSLFIRHDGLDDNSLLISKTVHALLITKCRCKALSLVSLAPRRHGFEGIEAWRVLKEEYGGQRWKSHSSALERHPQPTCQIEKMHSERRDLGDMLASWKKDVAQNRVAAGTDLQRAVQEATVMEHAPAAYGDLLKVVPLANRETYQALRAYVRERTLAQRTYDDHGRYTTPDTSAPMDIRQVNGTTGEKVRKARKEKKGERQGQERHR